MAITYNLHRERPVADVPTPIKAGLVLVLLMQLLWHSLQAPVTAEQEKLPEPLSPRAYMMMSLGEPIAAAKLMNLWLQAFDSQPGAHVSFHQLDYVRLTHWLDTILQLDPQGVYPMLVAARVYGSINDAQKQRIMTEYIYDKFNEDPNRYWRWLAHAVITAKHEIKDQALALKYADALAQKATGKNVPYWARDLKIIVLEDMGELEAAQILTGALIESGEISDPYELNFLMQKITVLEEKMLKKQQSVEK